MGFVIKKVSSAMASELEMFFFRIFFKWIFKCI